MANTLQKRIVFSKGQIRPDLVERTDLSFYDRSARLLQNLTSTVSGGVRNRRGTVYVDKIKAKQTGGTLALYNDYTISAIGANRNVLTIDTGSVIEDNGDNYLNVTGLKIDGEGLEIAKYTGAGTYTVTIPAEKKMRIKIHGGGGGSSCWNGGAGAFLDYTGTVPAGEMTVVIGAGGAGCVEYARKHDGVSGEQSSISYAGFSATCPGGTGGENKQKAGHSFAPTHGSGITIHAASTQTARRESWLTGTSYGAGGTGVYKKDAGNAGNSGYMSAELLSVNYVWEYSEDGETWQTLQSGTLNNSQTLTLHKQITGSYRYIRLRLDEDSGFNISGTLHVGNINISGYSTVTTGTKLLPYIYNNNEQYLLVLINGEILVYRNNVKTATISAPRFTQAVMRDLKCAYTDDTLIFTHEDMPPQILKHISATEWTLSELAIESTPYALFGAKQTETKNVKITPSGAEGNVKLKAETDIFTADYVGQYIDGGGGRVQITEYKSATEVTGNTVIPFYTNEAFDSWQYISGYEPVWSAARGYPRCCLFAQQRLWFGGSKSKPASVWASRVGDYYNFKNYGNYDNDAISVDLLTNDVIVNMIENRGIHIFTSGQEITISETNLTPDAIRAVTNTKNGSYAAITPVVVDGAVIYAEKNKHSLLSYIYDDNQAAYVSTNLSLLNDLIKEPVAMTAEINSARDKGNYLYIALADGTMVVNCILIDQEINSPAKFITAGSVIDVCCLVSDTYLLVARSNELYLERVDDVLTDCTMTMMAQGKTLTVDEVYKGGRIYVSGEDFAEVHTVTDTTVTLNLPRYGTVEVGIPFTYDMISNPLNINGRSFDIKKRIAKATVVTLDTPVLYFNGQYKYDEEVYRFYSCTPYLYDACFEIKGEYYPVNVLSVTLDINYGS